MMRPIALVLVGSFSLLAAAEPAAPAKVMGDSWEITSQMSMEGAPMAPPAHKNTVCVPKGQEPMQADPQHNCTNSDIKKDGSKVTWKTVCEGGMAGQGEITYSDAANYTGTIKITAPQGSMTVKLTGKRLEAPCEVKGK